MLNFIKNNPDWADIWDLYTRKEEYTFPWPDKHQRFSSTFSKNEDILIPHVSKLLFEKGFRPKYPDGKTFAICLTHDIDNLFIRKQSSINQTIRSVLRADYGSFRKHSKTVLNKRNNPYYELNKIIDLEKRYDGKSSFYFLSLKENELDFNYRLEDIKDVFGLIKTSGCEIGLHAGHLASENFDKYLSEKNYLESVISAEIAGNRNHYLKFKTPGSWDVLSRAGIKYDTTLGYHNYVGFRNGMCYPYYPFNLESDQFESVLEIPLVIMDDALHKYMLMDQKPALDLCKQLVETTKSYNGVLTFLWHNNHPLGLDFYEQFLKFCNDSGAWITSCDEMYHWWTEHNSFTI
jgi:hypothetical protein